MELRSFVFVAMSCIGGNLLDVSADNSRIYGGYPINITDAPYMVHVVYANTIFANGSALTNTCGGSILRKNLILTAGHCEHIFFRNLLIFYNLDYLSKVYRLPMARWRLMMQSDLSFLLDQL